MHNYPYGREFGNSFKVSVILCTLNEEMNLPHVLPLIPLWVHEVLLVDGGSTDKTIEVARHLRPNIIVKVQPGRGKGNAIMHGIKFASGDVIVTIDADGSNDPKEIPKFLEPLLHGYQFSKGSRFLKGGGTSDMPVYRIVANRLFTTLTNLLYRTKYTDLAYGYNAFLSKPFKEIELAGNGFEIETEINIKAAKIGLSVVEVPSFEGKRINGKGHLSSFRDGWKILNTIIKERYVS